MIWFQQIYYPVHDCFMCFFVACSLSILGRSNLFVRVGQLPLNRILCWYGACACQKHLDGLYKFDLAQHLAGADLTRFQGTSEGTVCRLSLSVSSRRVQRMPPPAVGPSGAMDAATKSFKPLLQNCRSYDLSVFCPPWPKRSSRAYTPQLQIENRCRSGRSGGVGLLFGRWLRIAGTIDQDATLPRKRSG